MERTGVAERAVNTWRRSIIGFSMARKMGQA
jgi:hypothetical protein